MVGDDRQLWTQLDDIRAGPGEEVTRLWKAGGWDLQGGQGALGQWLEKGEAGHGAVLKTSLAGGVWGTKGMWSRAEAFRVHRQV